jgi:AbrB family looped-hinge helix DNA binding protein
MIATLTSKGQLTLPKEVRDRLKLHPGDRLDFRLEDDGTVRMVPISTSVRDLKGILPKPKRARSLEDMDAAIAKGVLRR